MRLTDAGSALLARAKEALALAHDGFEAARAVAAGRRGRLTVGYMFALGYAVLPRLVPKLRQAMPDVDLQFVEMSALTYEAMIIDLKVTAALCMPPVSREGVSAVRLGTQPLRVVLPARSPLSRLRAVPLAKLQGRKLIGLPTFVEGADSSIVGSLLRKHHVTMQVSHRVETVHSALALVMAGEGFAILPACAALGSPPGLVFKPLLDVTDGFEVAVCWRSDLHSPLLKPLIECARASLA
jgi:DNA-binding transcriptional LysR family regulator